VIVAADQAFGVEPPRVQHRDPGADIAQRDREVDGMLPDLGRPSPTRQLQPLLIEEADLLLGIVGTRLHQ